MKLYYFGLNFQGVRNKRQFSHFYALFRYASRIGSRRCYIAKWSTALVSAFCGLTIFWIGDQKPASEKKTLMPWASKASILL